MKKGKRRGLPLLFFSAKERQRRIPTVECGACSDLGYMARGKKLVQGDIHYRVRLEQLGLREGRSKIRRLDLLGPLSSL